MRYLPFGLQRPYILLCVAVLAATLSSCRSWIRPGTDVPQSLNATTPFAQGSAVLLPGADYHLVTVRRPAASQDDILCSEPSPDWAIAFGTALAGAASGGASGGPSGSFSGSASTTEAITAAAGRTAGVVALRDGLYSACQAYANQLIGKDAYSLILSQYGNLLVALASGGGGGASAATPPSSPLTPPGVAVAVSTGAASGSPSPSSPPSGGSTAQGGNPQVALLQQEAVQAMLVACIGYNDKTINHGEGNTLLNNYCGPFMVVFGQALPDLLKPQAQAGQGATQKSGGAKTTSVAAKKDPVILLVQQKLNSLSPSKIKEDGINGPQTDEALAAFQKDKKIPDGGLNDATLKAMFQ